MTYRNLNEIPICDIVKTIIIYFMSTHCSKKVLSSIRMRHLPCVMRSEVASNNSVKNAFYFMFRLNVRNDELQIFSIFLKYVRILEPMKGFREMKSVL